MEWSIENIKSLGFVLIKEENKWCHFRGHGFDVHINLDTKRTNGNHFNFHSYKANNKGNFKAIITSENDFQTLLRLII